MKGKELLERDLRRAGNLLIGKSIEELKDQGHVNTGKGIKSLRYEIVQTGNSLELLVKGERYLVYLSEGTKPHFPPIAEILKWVKQRNIGGTPKESKRAAWAIATKISKKGTPLSGSFKFSKNGRRTKTRLAVDLRAPPLPKRVRPNRPLAPRQPEHSRAAAQRAGLKGQHNRAGGRLPGV